MARIKLKGLTSFNGSPVYKVGDHSQFEYPIIVELDGMRFRLFALGFEIGKDEDGYWLCDVERKHMIALREVKQ